MRRVIATFFLLICVHPALAEPITVFAAASLRGALDEAVALWPGTEPPRVVYAGTSTLARQIRDGAPADLFISANAAWMDVLDDAGLIDGSTRRDLFGNWLVLVANEPNDVGPAKLPDALANERIALALVNAVPAGMYAREAFEALGLWEAVRPAVVQVDNVRIALALVSRGEVAFAVVYGTDARLSDTVHVAYEFPEESHAPIVYPAALVTGAGDEAVDLLNWLGSPDAAEIFRAHGFAVPGAP